MGYETHIDVPAEGWVYDQTGYDDEYPQDRLMLTVFINDVPHHLEAIRVKYEGAIQRATGRAMDETFASLHAAFGGDGPFHTIKIDGDEYAVFLSPFCS